MVQGFRKNFPRKYKGKSLACQHCLRLQSTKPTDTNPATHSSPSEPPTQVPDDSQIHATVCPAYTDLHDRLDIVNSDSDIVEFFKLILERRSQEGEA